MINFLKKYKAFFIGLIVIPISYLLERIGIIIIPEGRILEFIPYLIFWGLVIALPIYFFNYSKNVKKTIIKVLSLLVLLFITLGIDSIMNLPDNPITLLLIAGFWIGFVYVLVPSFIKKYWKLILIIYGPLLLYFIYLRLFSGGLEGYLKIKLETSFFVFILPIPFLFLVWIFEQWKWIRSLKAEKSKAELSLLRAQINPHFFFNTLNNLYALTIKNSKQAPDVILKLSDMMRYTIYEGEKERVKLGDEIEYLNNYIELHKIRHKKTVNISFNHDIDTSLSIAPLLYIILLENAFKHGIETLTENAFIHINLYEDTDFIYFKIENNFDPKEISEAKGIGLTNLKLRLALIYPKKHELTVDKTNNTYKVTLKIYKHA
ncbi:sensor histidine kinase [Lutibacter flavus]|uniref:GHKL domain-containing protein n=1 Tax=Lutibacter flavus TaxID=691689 RepID=A0A238XCS9_9FLAO|nr:histidine kinase [Lutibacter flavus]SNR56381.1 GHKL domain-containing protein [Lutibacter flavus]